MDSTYYLAQEEAPEGKPLKVFERNAVTGQLIGEYVGYRNARRGVYTLYPKYNPYASKNGKLRKHEVSEMLVRFP